MAESNESFIPLSFDQQVQIVYYTPLETTGPVPPPLQPCEDLLPWEKKVAHEKEREEKRKKLEEANRLKKKCNIIYFLCLCSCIDCFFFVSHDEYYW